jgi:hypothetical protein
MPKKPSLAFFGFVDRGERQGFPGSTGIASSDATGERSRFGIARGASARGCPCPGSRRCWPAQPRMGEAQSASSERRAGGPQRTSGERAWATASRHQGHHRHDSGSPGRQASHPAMRHATEVDSALPEGHPREVAHAQGAGVAGQRSPGWAKRSQHRVSEGLEARSERPASGRGQPRAVTRAITAMIRIRERACTLAVFLCRDGLWRGWPYHVAGLWKQAKPRMAKRSGHAVSGGPEGRSERPATW